MSEKLCALHPCFRVDIKSSKMVLPWNHQPTAFVKIRVDCIYRTMITKALGHKAYWDSRSILWT